MDKFSCKSVSQETKYIYVTFSKNDENTAKNDCTNPNLIEISPEFAVLKY